MRLISFTESSNTRIGLLQGDHILDLSQVAEAAALSSENPLAPKAVDTHANAVADSLTLTRRPL